MSAEVFRKARDLFLEARALPEAPRESFRTWYERRRRERA